MPSRRSGAATRPRPALCAAVAALATIIAAFGVTGAAGREWVIEHMYFDVRQKFLRASVDSADLTTGQFVQDNAGTVLTPITAKCKCKGAGCPEIDGQAIRITDSRWPSLHDKTLYAEETAGWYMLWCNEQRTVPAVPDYEEIERVFDGNERGYLNVKSAGKIVVR